MARPSSLARDAGAGHLSFFSWDRRRLAGSAELDATILELETAVSDASPLFLQRRRQTAFNVGDRVVVVGYPHGGALSFSLSESAIVSVDDHFVHYRTPTVAGSSGSPVFGANWNLLAMHHAGRSDAEGPMLNEGIRVSAVLAALDQYPSIQAELSLEQL